MDIRVEADQVEFLYADDDFVTFMNTETYEQPQLNRAIFGDDLRFIKDSMAIKLLSYEGEIIDYELPKTMEYQVVEVEAARRRRHRQQPDQEDQARERIRGQRADVHQCRRCGQDQPRRRDLRHARQQMTSRRGLPHPPAPSPMHQGGEIAEEDGTLGKQSR